MELSDVVIEIERLCARNGMNKSEATVSDLIAFIHQALELEELF